MARSYYRAVNDGSAISVAILGPLVVASDGEPVPLPSRIERALVASLAVRAGVAVPAERLATEVWGDDLADGWRQNLTVTVSRLRNRLARRLGPDGRTLIETVADGYRLAIRPDRFDAVRFERLAAEGRGLLERGSPGGARDTLTAALGLWRGAPLPEMADSAAGRGEASRLSELHEGVVDAWHEAALAQGDHDTVIAGLEASLIEDPLRERRWGQLMLALYRAGRQAEALRAYQRVRTVLADQLGVEPGPDLRRLEAAVLDHDPAIDLLPPRGAPPGRAGPPVTAGEVRQPDLGWLYRQLEVPLVGRERVVARVLAHWEHVRAERTGGVVFIEGDLGVGKTRLAAEVARLAAQDGARVLAARCAPGAGLSALVPALATIGLARPDGDLGPGSPVAFELGVEAAGIIIDSSIEQPTLLVLDDAQWADAQMISLFRQLGNRPLPILEPATALALVLIQSGVERPTGMAEFLGNVDRMTVSDRLVLEPLATDEAHTLLVDRLGAEVAERAGPVVDALVRDLAGNPRALIEYARHLRALVSDQDRDGVGLTTMGGVEDLGVPHALRVATDERLDRESPEVVGLLLAAAVIGPTFTVVQAARGAGVDEDTALTGLERAVSARFVDEGPEHGDDYRFISEVDRHVALARLSSARRARIQERLDREE